MNEITNKHLFLTMIIIGVITIGLLLSQYRGAPYGVSSSYDSYTLRNSLGASAYRVYDDSGNYEWYPNNTTAVSVTPITQTPSYSYKTYYYYSYPQEETYYDYYNGGSQGYVPAGCESGTTDYSTTTGEACG